MTPDAEPNTNCELRIGGRRLDELSRDELIDALEERLRINVGLVAENTKLRRIVAEGQL